MIHPNWTNPEYWKRNDRYIELDYSPRPSKTYWRWPDQEGN